MKFGKKIRIKRKIDGVHLKTILNKILKVPVFPSCAFADMMSWWDGPVHKLRTAENYYLFNFLRKIYLSGPQQVRRGLIWHL